MPLLSNCVCKHIVFNLNVICLNLLFCNPCNKATFRNKVFILLSIFIMTSNHWGFIWILKLNFILILQVLSICCFFKMFNQLMSRIHIEHYLWYSMNPVVVVFQHLSTYIFILNSINIFNIKKYVKKIILLKEQNFWVQ